MLDMVHDFSDFDFNTVPSRLIVNLFLLTLCPRVRAAHLGQEGLLRDKITMSLSLSD